MRSVTHGLTKPEPHYPSFETRGNKKVWAKGNYPDLGLERRKGVHRIHPRNRHGGDNRILLSDRCDRKTVGTGSVMRWLCFRDNDLG